MISDSMDAKQGLNREELNNDLGILPHFQVGEYTPHHTFVDDHSYALMLDNMVKACTDILLITPENKLLLGKRNVQPQPDFWMGGGRMKPGESPGKSGARLMKCEFGLDIHHARFEHVCAATLVWDRREQLPATNGTADVQVILALHLSVKEMENVVLSGTEYDESKVVALSEVSEGPEDMYSPILVHAVRSYVANGILREVKQLVGKTDTATDEVSPKRSKVGIEKLMQRYFELKSMPSGTSAYKLKDKRVPDYCAAVTTEF
ncbi:hypothetical protein SARC_01469 [Sphaeroforma arctica JP610]|uniref:Nudix hydrolase domain-containing protein n=1 Tax=Sphaeroforma arctica JP610 TaxID=667725 RepID=A0A0L0GDN3_9EUKA|nr:hypothetical protein SARC_01469 [Sphaeroforma arctica JP610]KNC86373.1 hypothetical protein SARC_01469 [Sphaeroforma arctica JP610]|eukprot:XP_014160275.1 hypothetical protein SARC_01469 [Sphaeroforma arctica JP610]